MSVKREPLAIALTFGWTMHNDVKREDIVSAIYGELCAIPHQIGLESGHGDDFHRVADSNNQRWVHRVP